MKIIKVYVPDNDCKGCDFLSHSSYESHYQSYQERYYCTIFKCDIEKNQKCMACKMLADTTEKGGEEYKVIRTDFEHLEELLNNFDR